MIPAPIPPNGITIIVEKQFINIMKNNCGLITFTYVFFCCAFLPFAKKNLLRDTCKN